MTMAIYIRRLHTQDTYTPHGSLYIYADRANRYILSIVDYIKKRYRLVAQVYCRDNLYSRFRSWHIGNVYGFFDFCLVKATHSVQNLHSQTQNNFESVEKCHVY